MNRELSDVIEGNLVVQMRARDLNLRAGKNIFPLMSYEEMQTWLRARLHGAVSAGTITDFDSLRLPELSSTDVAMVLETNPDTIDILGKKVKVEYSHAFNRTSYPWVVIGDEFIAGNLWNNLPDDGIRLPSGRLVNVILQSKGAYSAIAESTSIPVFKQAVKNRLNLNQWEKWIRPAIAVPDFSEPNVVLPEVTTAQYGKCVITGEPLMAFGTLVVNRGYWNTDPMTWSTMWFQTKLDASRKLAEAQVYLASAKVQARENKEREALVTSASVIRVKVSKMISEGVLARLDFSLRVRFEGIVYNFFPLELRELSQWIASAELTLVEVEKAIGKKPEDAHVRPSLNALAEKWGARRR